MVVMEVELSVITFSGSVIGHGEDSPLGIGGEVLGNDGYTIHGLYGFFETIRCPGKSPDILLDAVDGLGQGSDLMIGSIGHGIAGLFLGGVFGKCNSGHFIFVIPEKFQGVVIGILDLG